MGRYFNPATKEAIVAKGGRRLGCGPHSEVVANLKPGEKLGWHLDRGRFKQVPDVTEPEEFKEFDRQVNSGDVLPLGFYAIPDDAFQW